VADDALAAVTSLEAQRDTPPFMAPLLDEVHARFPTSVHAVFFYGSCRRTGRPDGVVDLYVVLDGTRDLRGLNRLLSAVLPPSVYFLEVPPERNSGTAIRCKCSTVLLPAFRNGTSRRWFLSYLWARFSQPVTLAWARDEAARQDMLDCLARAAETFVRRAVPLMADEFGPAEFWVKALAASYRTEIRSESLARIEELYTLEHEHLDRVLAAAARAGGAEPVAPTADPHVALYRNATPTARRRRALWIWRARVVVGKILSGGRIVKSWYTFDGGLDYVAWKLERHSGQRIVIPDAVRARPWLRVWGFLWQLYRRGVFR
jgi:hypothetical protein